MNRSGRPCLSKMIWTKINSNLIHMFAPQLICPSTKLPFRQLSAVWCKGNFTDEKATFGFILQIFLISKQKSRIKLEKKNGYDRVFWLFFMTLLTPPLSTRIFEFFSNKFIVPNLKTYWLLFWVFLKQVYCSKFKDIWLTFLNLRAKKNC